MTRCCREDASLVNLKSSAYNQTGESYHEQLAIHRYMNNHWRRVVLAKSVVDTKNPRYTRMMQRRSCRRPPSSSPKPVQHCPTSLMIDRLAYDNEHYPSDILKIQCQSNNHSKERRCSDRSRSRDTPRTSIDAKCPCVRPRDCSCASRISPRDQRRSDNLTLCGAGQRRISIDDRRNDSKRGSTPCLSGRSSRKCKFEAGGYSGEEDDSSPGCSPSTRRCKQQACDHQNCPESEDSARYAKFVYDITQEIVQNGLYTDDELKRVFHCHLERNAGQLNKRKMLYEIYQLKISLNMLDDSEDEDELEANLVFAEKFSGHRAPKPPTPPKVLNENKLVEKLESFKLMDENCDENCKGVIFVDANPEFLVNERDVLSTLMDNDIDPEQIQRIYKNLFQKSKDMTLCEAVQVGREVSYSNKSKCVDRCSSPISMHAKCRPPGILRRESTDPSVLDGTHRRSDYIQSKQKEAFEKCAKWATAGRTCGSRTPDSEWKKPPDSGIKSRPTSASRRHEWDCEEKKPRDSVAKSRGISASRMYEWDCEEKKPRDSGTKSRAMSASRRCERDREQKKPPPTPDSGRKSRATSASREYERRRGKTPTAGETSPRGSPRKQVPQARARPRPTHKIKAPEAPRLGGIKEGTRPKSGRSARAERPRSPASSEESDDQREHTELNKNCKCRGKESDEEVEEVEEDEVEEEEMSDVMSVPETVEDEEGEKEIEEELEEAEEEKSRDAQKIFQKLKTHQSPGSVEHATTETRSRKLLHTEPVPAGEAERVRIQTSNGSSVHSFAMDPIPVKKHEKRYSKDTLGARISRTSEAIHAKLHQVEEEEEVVQEVEEAAAAAQPVAERRGSSASDSSINSGTIVKAARSSWVRPKTASEHRRHRKRTCPGDDQSGVWNVSPGSSDTTSSSPPPAFVMRRSEPDAAVQVGRVERRRTSSGMSGFETMGAWNRRLSEVTPQLQDAGCSPGCRRNNGCSLECNYAGVGGGCNSQQHGRLDCLKHKRESRSSDSSPR